MLNGLWEIPMKQVTLDSNYIFDFKKYIFKIITIEHNYTENREKIFNLLTKNGYSRKYKELSIFDDWYVYTNKNIE